MTAWSSSSTSTKRRRIRDPGPSCAVAQLEDASAAAVAGDRAELDQGGVGRPVIRPLGHRPGIPESASSATRPISATVPSG